MVTGPAVARQLTVDISPALRRSTSSSSTGGMPLTFVTASTTETPGYFQNRVASYDLQTQFQENLETFQLMS
jgi:hypothetical protein